MKATKLQNRIKAYESPDVSLECTSDGNSLEQIEILTKLIVEGVTTVLTRRKNSVFYPV